jgi:RNA polymerase sigma factor (sigma-70 family)
MPDASLFLAYRISARDAFPKLRFMRRGNISGLRASGPLRLGSVASSEPGSQNLRREGREPAHHAETLEIVHDSPASEALPSEQAVSREEEAILWRSLERIPESYREPLILFYREHQSVAAVAMELELSEDAVKQRLSRGRKLLREEVQAFVENTLRRTRQARRFDDRARCTPRWSSDDRRCWCDRQGAQLQRGILGALAR